MKKQNILVEVHSQICAEANNNSPSMLLHRMNCRAGNPPPTLFKHIITNRKKIFLFLCAFIMGTWIGSSFPYNQFGRPPIGDHNCGDATPSLSATVTGSTGAIRETPKKLNSSRNSTVILKNETSSNGTSRTTSQSQKSEQRVLTTSEPTKSHEAKLVSTPSEMKKTSRSNESTTAKVDSEGRVSNKTAGRAYLVDTPTCQIPNFDPWDPSLLHAVKKLDRLTCGGQRQLTYVQNGILAINDSILESEYGIQHLTNVSCCYRTIQRPNGTKDDDKIEISKDCIRFFNQTPIPDEFLQVECVLRGAKPKNLTEFLYSVPAKPSVEARCWNASRDSFSVMLLGLDAVSRLNFERHLVKTRRVLLEDLGAVELQGYNKVGDNTFPNVVPLLSGLSSDGLKKLCWPNKKSTFDGCPWLWKDFAAAGYRTLYGEDSVHIGTFNYLKPGFAAPPTDYYLRPFLCAAEAAVGRQGALNTKLCLGPRPHHEVTLDWAGRFMEAFEDRPYFGLLWSNSLTHDDADLVQHADDFLSAMLARLRASGRLDRTVLVVLSDHGIRWGPLRKTSIGRYEERLPALFISLPEAFRRRHPQKWRSLVDNAQRLVSPFDLHATLREVLRLAGGRARGPTPEAGRSLFEPVALNRTCGDAGINAHWCACQQTVALDVHQTEAASLAEFVLRHLNSRTKEVRALCGLFSLSKIVSVLRKSSVQLREEGDGGAIYVVTIEVTPGGGIFEVTVRTGDKESSVEGDVSRLNMYGTLSNCVQDIVLRKMCHCVKH